MSEDWGADFIPGAGRVNLVEALSVAQHLPAEALAGAVVHPERVAPDVLRVLDRAAGGEELTARERNLLFWGLHVLGAARDARGWAPFLRLLRRPHEDVEALLGEALVSNTLPRIAAGLFDGASADLTAAIADRSLDEFVRWALFGTLAFLTFDGRVPREDTRRFLLRFDDERLARSGDNAWAGWEETIALLGFADMADRVAAARQDARLLDNLSDPDWFAQTLADAQANPDDATRFAERDLGYFEDIVAELDAALAGDEDAEPIEPLRNPLRDIGRNDPCPCGSGKKFKKCCLAPA